MQHRHEVAAKIHSTYGSRKATEVRGLAAAAAAVEKAQAAADAGGDGWGHTFGVSTDADVALRWLQLQMKPQIKDPALLRAEFVAVFPGKVAGVAAADSVVTAECAVVAAAAVDTSAIPAPFPAAAVATPLDSWCSVVPLLPCLLGLLLICAVLCKRCEMSQTRETWIASKESLNCPPHREEIQDCYAG